MINNSKKISQEIKEEVGKIFKLLISKVLNCILDFFKQIQIFSYSKVFLNVTLTFILPIIMFSIPIMSGSNDLFLENVKNKIQSGILFSTSISILSTIISSYVDNATVSKKNKTDNNTKTMKDMKNVLPIILLAFLLTVLGAYYYGQKNDKSSLNSIGISIQIFLYVLVQIVYGVADSKIKNSPFFDIFDEKKNLKQNRKNKLMKMHRKLKMTL